MLLEIFGLDLDKEFKWVSLGQGIHMPQCFYNQKDQNHASHGIPNDTQWKLTLDFKEAKQEEYWCFLNYGVGEDS